MPPNFKAKGPVLYLGLAGVYFVAGKLALQLAFLNASASAVWPCTGIALAALLLFGYRLWPAIFAGAFLVNFTTAGNALPPLGLSPRQTLPTLPGPYLVTPFASCPKAFSPSQTLFYFSLLPSLTRTPHLPPT